ncbi:TlpA family protein disulfide reductase [Desulfovibrio intestinalis]|uniref:Thiol-disulfide isomerase/thioredoxin n=1 Tax=Desulfovibrio intestinalis TaxID=58621 RepID=A0A7W8C201_9BACT|nr:TlpA disulfide reductase family protein [Desulfovibrio intestinalis]MBB5142724.1 thiol-disulfide isomerase/thioredoxin [Desulfovibrio intestinalis]
MKKIILPLLLCLLLPCAAFGASASVPSLNLAGLTDLLAKNKGKVIMLNFFATWCPPCQVEVPDLVAVNKKFAGKDVLIISLSVDEDEKVVVPFMKKMGMDYPVYMAGRDITKAFQVSSIPHNVFYAKDGQRVISEPGIADTEMMEMVFNKLLEQK